MQRIVPAWVRGYQPAWAPVDAHPTRVRLPDEPLMLVDRIVAFEGEPRAELQLSFHGVGQP